MKRVYNFSAGPGMLPDDVLELARSELLDWHGKGMSIMEMGHRGLEFGQIAQQAEDDLRDLMNIPDNYHVLFVPGGATAQFAMVPVNLLSTNKKADYIDTGIWSKKAIAEAKRYGDINVVSGTTISGGKVSILPQSEWQLESDAAYLHYTPNETIEGVMFQNDITDGDKPIVADMSSIILSRPIDVSKYAIIYAGAQKNLGQAGITVVIVRDDMVGKAIESMPTLYQYKTHVDSRSFYNTPPTFSWYMTGLVLSWLKRYGGVKAIHEKNVRNATKLYECIDGLSEFYINPVHTDYRSITNIVANLKNDKLLKQFLDEANEADLTNLKGHRAVGGIRASMYNAMPERGVDALADFMRDFARRNG